MKILVIGETCLDHYVYGSCDRVCPEAAALCFKSNGKSNSSVGMASNVMANILAIDSNLTVDIITNPLEQIIKRRFIDTRYNSIVFRQDIDCITDKLHIKNHKFDTYDAIVISDYNKGFIAYEDYEAIDRLRNKNALVFVDSKKKITSSIYNNVDFIKINSHEFAANIDNVKNIVSCCDLIVTKGGEGATLISYDKIENFNTKQIEIRDVCGAGDTFLAALVVHHLKTNNIEESIKFANISASKVVSKFGVCTP